MVQSFFNFWYSIGLRTKSIIVICGIVVIPLTVLMTVASFEIRTVIDLLIAKVGGIEAQFIEDRFIQSMWLIGFTYLVSLIGGTIIVIVYTNSLLNPLISLTTIATKSQDSEHFLKKIDQKAIKRNDEIGELSNSFINAISSLQTIIIKNQEVVNHLTSTTQEISANSEEVNTITEETLATIKSISQGAVKQSELISTALTTLNSMNSMVDTALSSINSTLDLIEQITRRINLVAVNASIEASHAGEYGRGFSIVAENIRKLAEETKLHAIKLSEISLEVVSGLRINSANLRYQLQELAVHAEEYSASSEEATAGTEEQAIAINQLTHSLQDLNNLSNKMLKSIEEFSI